MNRPPITRFYNYPVTAGLGILAVIVTFGAMSRHTYEPFTMTVLAFEGEPWRLVSSALPHSGLGHLLLDVLWLWIFGVVVEDIYGPIRTLVLFVLLELASSTVEYALFRGGIGLSGIGYGLFGLLFVLSRLDPRFRGAVDRRIALMFAGWFVFCIVTTVLGLWSVGNVSHGVGAVVGMLIGIALAPTNIVSRVACGFGVASCLVFGLAGASVLRPHVNLSKNGGSDSAHLGYEALQSNRNFEAIAHCRRAIEITPTMSLAWYNMAIALRREGHDEEALDALRRAYALDPAHALHRDALAKRLAYSGAIAASEENSALAEHLLKESLAVGGEDAKTLRNLGRLYDSLGRTAEAKQAWALAIKLDPSSQPEPAPTMRLRPELKLTQEPGAEDL